MKGRTNRQPLPSEEWDFRKCPEIERVACHHYEYAREYVSEQPGLAGKLADGYRPPPYDNLLKFIYSDKAHPDSLPMRCPDFPINPWLKLSPKTRSLLIGQCQMLPEKDASNTNLLVEDEFDVVHLQRLDKLRADLFSKWLQEERDRGDRESSALISGVHFAEEPIEFPVLCGGPKRYYAVDEPTALAVIRLDWHKSDNDLKAAFKQLLERRPGSMVQRKEKPSKGGRGGVSDQLKKLGARRLRAYYKSPEAAVEALDLICFDAKIKSPYTDADALDRAASKARKVLESLDCAGRFRPFADL